ncbi:hypothetical protein RUM43_002098 [Polyplax serrata]|uniref:Uncharacterized protein n=1 Tax=Polyplax serrata TaxID=468196 RepID=A0AAN8PFI6_POLSC
MFKTSIFLACLVAFAIAANVPHGTEKKVEADKEFLAKQKAVLQLLLHVHQSMVTPELKDFATTYDLEQDINNFKDGRVVKHFLKMYRTTGVLDRSKVFTPFYKAHAQQAKAVVDVFFNAKDWNTFLRTASWMREHVNDGLFVYALSIALLHRPDTQGIVIPPFYEICPHLYINAETIQRAYNARMKYISRSDKESVILYANYTGWTNTHNPELRTSYLIEDVGYNFYHDMHHLSYPNWLNKEHVGINNDRQGELFYFHHQQLLARYRLERHANNMYQMRNFTYEDPHIVAYHSNLRYKNGESVPPRPENIKLRDFDLADLERVKDLEYRIRDAIDSGYVKTVKGEKLPINTEKGTETLGRIIEQTSNSVNPKYYGSVYHHTLNLLGHIMDPYHQNNIPPSTFAHYHTMLRDPMYYRVYDRINKFFQVHKKNLPLYTKENLEFPGVEIENVEVDKLLTYFENFDIDITNAIRVGKIDDDKTLKIFARQSRLNHKDYTYRITVKSSQDTTGLVQIYLAPKYDVTGQRELSLVERKQYMILLDKFTYQLKNGNNVIERSSRDSTVTIGETTGFRGLFKKVEDALQGRSQFYINDKGQEYGFPRRLLLPKGTKNGTPYTLYVVINPYQPSGSREQLRGLKTFTTCGGDVFCGDSLPYGFPFDRDNVEADLLVPNMRKTDVTIYHKKMEENNI